MPLTEGIDVLKWGNQISLWSRAAELRTVAVGPVLAVLGCGLSVRMILVVHMTLVVLGMLMYSISCYRQIGTGIHLESNKVNMQSQKTLPPPGSLDQGGKDIGVAMDSRTATDIQVATRK